MKRRLFSFGSLFATLAILVMTGCHDQWIDRCFPDGDGRTDIEPTGEGEQDVDIVLDIPEMLQSTSLRSLSSEQESDAAAIRILAFNVPAGGNGDRETYAYEPRIKKGPTLKEGKYYVTLILNKGATPQRLVLLANLPDGKLPDAVTEGATKKDIYKSLVYDYTAKGWKSDGEKSGAVEGTDYNLIPMWGESRAFTVVPGDNTIKDYYYDDGVIRLYRALARVDVGMNFDTAPQSTDPLPETNKGMDKTAERLFDLTDVYVYHPAKSYRMAGSMSNIGNVNGKYKATAPTLPADVKYHTGKTESELTNHYTIDPEIGRLVRSIYLPESKLVTSEKISEELEGNTCIVVGGVYKGNHFNPKGKSNTDKTYYRIDFVSVEKEGGKEKTTRLPILRNHRYRINILKIDGPGHKTPEDAIKNTVSDVIYSVSVWDESETSKVVTDGKYWLKLSSDKLKVGRLGGKLPITFETNCPEGWELTVPEKYAPDPDKPDVLIPNPLYAEKEWVQSLQGKGAPAKDVHGTKSSDGLKTKPESVDFQIKRKKQDGKTKEGVFMVKTYGGRLNWTIRVEQTDEFDLVLEIYKDREMTQQTNFIEVHEEGWSFDKTIEVDGKSYTPGDQGSYSVFYVRAIPYENMSQKPANWDLTITHTGGDDFKFWSYSGQSGYRGPDRTNIENNGFSETDFLSFNDYFKKHNYVPYMFKQVGNNLYELAISNDAMTNAKDPFEIRRNKFVFTLTVSDPDDPSKKASVSKSISVLQQEHNIVVYTDPDFTRRISYDPEHPEYFMMNGKERTLYVRSNIPGFVKLIRQGQDKRVRGNAKQDPQMIPIEKIIGAEPDYSRLTISRDELVRNIDTPQDIYYFPANMGRNTVQNKFSFNPRDDIHAPVKLNWGYGDWVVDTLDPFFKYKFFDWKTNTQGDDFRTEFVCVSVQPEANCYVVELDNFGIFIPLSRINTAADTFYKNWEEPYGFSDYITASGSGKNSWTQSYRSVPTGVTNWTDFKMEKNQGLHHLDEDDMVTPEFVWTDYRPYDRSNPGVLYDPKDPSKSKGPIKAMTIIEAEGERYLFLLPGADTEANVANTLIAVRSGKHNKIPTGIQPVDYPPKDCFEANGLRDAGTAGPDTKAILWSWHIITVPKDKRKTYMEVNDQLRDVVDNKNNIIAEHPGFMYQELGALRRPDRTKYDRCLIMETETYEVLGMTYQWGRKDPFPTECYDGELGYENLHFPHLKDAKGNPFRTQWLGDENFGFRFTYKMSIENPTVAVRASIKKAEHWLVEAGNETEGGSNKTQQQWQISKLWGGKLLGSSLQREGSSYESTKTVFDPCPYGFKIPSIGFETGMPFSVKDLSRYDAVKALGMNMGRPVTKKAVAGARINTERWHGPKSGNGFAGSGWTAVKFYHLHSADPVYAGNGRTGAWELKPDPDYFSGNSSSLAGEAAASKAAVYPILPIRNWREDDYGMYWNPRVRSLGFRH